MTDAAESVARTRVVLLGASNVAQSFSLVVDLAHGILGEPLEIFTAIGHGRSYGQPSVVLGRGLPGIRDCGVWDALAASEPAQTYALVTDIGNDIAYEASVPDILSWLELAFERLSAYEPRLVIGVLPLESLQRLGKMRFLAARSVLFPGRRITLDQVLERAREIDERVREMAADIGAAVVEPRGDWYGLDPVHVKRRYRVDAWRALLAPWSDEPIPRPTRMPLGARITLHVKRPAQYSILGRAKQNEQPCATLPGGTRVWKF